MKKKTNRKKWMKFRHKVVTAVAGVILSPYIRWKYGVRIDKFRQQGDRAYLVLLNHQTTFDQFFVGLSFRGPVYYVATEDIFSLGWISNVIRYIVAPIPIRKQTTDAQAVMTCLRVAREGGTIAMAPEGNRTYHGKTVYINPAVAALAKKMKLPIAIYRIEGGYGVQPRWCDGTRKGKMRAGVREVIEPEEYLAMTNEEMYQRICKGLEVNENCVSGEFHHKNLAQYLERAIYVCPECGLSEFESAGDLITCKKCGKQVRYLPTRELEGVDWKCPFRFVADWYEYQCDYVNQLNTADYVDTPLYRDRAKVSEVIVYKHKNVLREQAQIALYGDRVVLDEGQADGLVLPFEEVYAAAVLGRNKLNIYHNDRIYQFKGDPRFNALKYVNIYHRNRNLSRGEENGKFLGL
ncbi:MAG: 1-acyl-sn-glycerol-3-phosphate acyltransferase [Oscillospiraceae bacterium]|nr:1-acyl-sn-glycerol-3-phosphate acyltransferase [Oscillospiraceae bacterium]